MALGDPYISRPQLKSVLGITDDSEDDLIERSIKAAATALNNKSGYSTFWNTVVPQTRVVDTYGRLVPRRSASPHLKLILPDGIASASGLSIPGYSAASLLPSDAISRGLPATEIRLPWGSIPDTLSITAVWGWPQVPNDIIMACQMQAQRYYKRRSSPEGISGSAEWGMVRIPRLDPDVAAILENGGYMNPGVG